MTPRALRLGPFELHLKLRSGGMGDIWWGRHADQNVPVAIKVLRRDQARDERYQTAFRNEVRQAARLAHAHIVTVLDHGEVPADVDALADGELRTGSPYLVMEFASQGSLREHMDGFDWPGLRTLLLELLDALGHAHARGVLHRDIKPENILRSARTDLRPGHKLTDWGLAPLLGAGTLGVSGGTPRYMAPEQVTGLAEAQGPSTDLYALGIVAFEIVSGAPPFVYRTARETLQAQVSAPVPPLEPRFPVPRDLEDWIRRCLNKDGQRRFQLAADAAWALRALGEAVEAAREEPARPNLGAWAPARPATETVREPLAWDEPEPAPHAAALPPMPPDWRAEGTGPLPPRLLGAGQGLYDLRPVALCGREREQDRLWAALRAVHEDRRPRVALLHGRSGFGKSALARWLLERSNEVGAAWGLRGTYGPGHGVFSGISGALAQHMGVLHLPAEAARSRLSQQATRLGLIDAWDLEGLPALVLGEDPPLEPHAPQRRVALATRLLGRIAADRPVVLWLDDAQWGPEALALATALLSGDPGDRSAVLLVLTVNDDALPGAPVKPHEIEVLAAGDRCMTLDIGALPDASVASLVRALLFLDDDLARRIVARSEGNPLFATQLVGDQVRRATLEVGEQGFRLRPGAIISLPETLHQLWQGLLDQASLATPEARDALGVAAALGREVFELEWRDACGALEVPTPTGLLDALFAANLATPTAHGWIWSHELLRDSLLRDARERRREAAIMRACARMVERAPGGAGHAERLGRFLLAAGEARASLGPLMTGVTERLDRSELPAAADLLELALRAVGDAGLAAADPRHAEVAIARVRTLIGRGEILAADALAARVAEDARRLGWTDWLGPALRYRAIVAQRTGDLQRAEALLIQAEGLATGSGDLRELGRCALHRGTVLRIRGEHQQALDALAVALARFRAIGDLLGEADSLSERGSAAMGLGDAARAEQSIRAAIPIYEQLRRTAGRGYCQNALGDLLKHAGDHLGARCAYQEAAELLRRAGSQAAVVPRLNLALLALLDEQWSEARTALEAGLDTVGRSGHTALEPYFRLGLMVLAALDDDWPTWDAHQTRISKLFAQITAPDRDLLHLIAMAVRHAEASGESARSQVLTRSTSHTGTMSNGGAS